MLGLGHTWHRPVRSDIALSAHVEHRPPTTSPTTCSGDRVSSPTLDPVGPFRQSPAPACGSHLKFSAPAPLARRWPRRWACRSRSPRASRPPCSSTRSASLVRASRRPTASCPAYLMLGVEVVATDADDDRNPGVVWTPVVPPASDPAPRSNPAPVEGVGARPAKSQRYRFEHLAHVVHQLAGAPCRRRCVSFSSNTPTPNDLDHHLAHLQSVRTLADRRSRPRR